MRDIGCKRQLMLSKAQIKYIRSLHHKKLRHTERVYVIEGEKIIHEYIQSNYPLGNIYATDQWIEENLPLLQEKKLGYTNISTRDLEKISSLTNPNKVVAIAKMKDLPELEHIESSLTTGLHLALDGIQDPGNLGTIIRTADWFGIDSIICSEDCVNVYNPKVIQATMGSLIRVKVYYTDLFAILQKTSLPLFSAVLDGENIFNQNLSTNAIIIIGSESKGISTSLKALSSQKICIPCYGKGDSLNVSIAAAIILALFKKG